MTDKMDRDTHNLTGDQYWVVPGRFLAGPYPVSTDEILNQKNIGFLIEIGISHFIDLTQENEKAPHYADVIDWSATNKNTRVSYIRFPIPDMDIPSRSLMKKILDHIDACLAVEEILYLHCMGGLGRTGTVVGCYLMRHGMSGEEALHRLECLRQNTDNHWKTSPETEVQRQFIMGWSG